MGEGEGVRVGEGVDWAIAKGEARPAGEFLERRAQPETRTAAIITIYNSRLLFIIIQSLLEISFSSHDFSLGSI